MSLDQAVRDYAVATAKPVVQRAPATYHLATVVAVWPGARVDVQFPDAPIVVTLHCWNRVSTLDTWWLNVGDTVVVARFGGTNLCLGRMANSQTVGGEVTGPGGSGSPGHGGGDGSAAAQGMWGQGALAAAGVRSAVGAASLVGSGGLAAGGYGTAYGAGDMTGVADGTADGDVS